MARRVVQTLPQMFINEAVEEEISTIPVAAYARVSTEKEEQEDSFERQVEHYTQMITSKPEWKFVKVYADPGITGTRAEKRPEFMQMIEDCRAGKIKKVLVKSISRFARNTVDSLTYIRELKELGISIYFESENIDTLTPGGEVLIAILSAMSEQEARTISTNIKWAWQRKFQAGDIILNTGLMLGYKKTGETDEDGHEIFEIVEEEAEIIRQIYGEFLKGTSIRRIAKILQESGKKTKRGKEKWSHSTIESILTNEKYTGNAILGKTWKADVLSKKRQKNDGKKAPIYYVEDTHPAIIDRGMFELAQKEMERRRASNASRIGGGKYSSRYAFSGMLVCGECGSKMRRQVRTMGSGKRTAAWCCANRVINSRAVCDSHHVNEEVLEKTYLAALKELIDNAAEVVETVKEGTALALEPVNKAEIERIAAEIMNLQEAALALHKAKQRLEIGEQDYAAKVKEYRARMKELEAKRDELQDAEVKYAEVKTWLDALIEQTMKADTLTQVDSTTMKMLVDRIIVKNEGIEVEFKCGVSIEKEYKR